MKRAYRIPYSIYKEDKVFEKHLGFMKKYIGAVDEVAIFADFSHQTYRPLSGFQETADIIERRIEQYRGIGIKSVGINILCTIGHCDEAWDLLDKSPLQTMVGESGYVTSGSLCPFSPGYEEYMSEKYRIFARTKPDFIWSDDDIRMVSHTINYACFCGNCMEQFNKAFGYSFNRESLTAALNSGDKLLRERWAKRQNSALTGIMRMIKKAVSEVNPGIKLGAMTFDNTMLGYSNSNFTELMDLEGAVKGRPGNGYYNDYSPLYIIHKSINVSMQTARYPKAVTDIQYEFENFPCQSNAKSIKASENESVLSLFSGCNGVAYNVFGTVNPDETFKMIEKKSPVFRKISKALEGSVQRGAHFMYSDDYDIKREVKGDYFQDNNSGEIFEYGTNLLEAGVAVTGFYDNADVLILAGRMSEGFSDEEIFGMLKKNLVLDGWTAEQLIKRGFGEYLGVKVKTKISSSMYEKLTNHSLNGNGRGYRRDTYLTFWDGGNERRRTVYSFLSLDKKAESLAELIRLDGKKFGMSSFIYENSLGGRIAVLGYTALRFIQSSEKMSQLKNIMAWMSGSFVRMREDKKISVYFREQKKKLRALLFNTSQDDFKNIHFITARDGEFKLTDRDNTETLIKSKDKEVGIPKLGSWDYIFVEEI